MSVQIIIDSGADITPAQAVELRRQGLSAAEIAACLELEKKNIKVLALLDTLEYLKRAGAFPKQQRLRAAC